MHLPNYLYIDSFIYVYLSISVCICPFPSIHLLICDLSFCLSLTIAMFIHHRVHVGSNHLMHVGSSHKKQFVARVNDSFLKLDGRHPFA